MTVNATITIAAEVSRCELINRLHTSFRILNLQLVHILGSKEQSQLCSSLSLAAISTNNLHVLQMLFSIKESDE